MTRPYHLIIAATLLCAACRPSDSASEEPAPEPPTIIQMAGDTTNALTNVLKTYQHALLHGDTATAMSLVTGKAQAILEYRFFDIVGPRVLLEYGTPSVRGDTGFVPFSVRRLDKADTATRSRAVLVRTSDGWKVERVLPG